MLWIAEVNDRVVGGNLNFYHRGHAVEWHATYDSESLKLGARNYAVHEILLDAIKRGSAVYDFNPSGGHEGTQAFKRTFGTTSLEAPVLKLVSTRLAIARRALRMIRSVVGRESRGQ